MKPTVQVVIQHHKQEDRRGLHWREKVLEGRGAPKPWLYNKEWAARYAEKEAELLAKCPNYPLPWRSTQVQALRSIGNTSKVLFMEIALHELNGLVSVNRVGDPTQGFLGIHGLVVAPEHRAAFDAGVIPSVSGARGDGSTNKYGLQVKTIVKIWQTVGLIERVRDLDGALVFVFDQGAAQQKRQTLQRAHIKRMNRQGAAAKTVVAAEEDIGMPQKEDRLVRHAQLLTDDAERLMEQARAAWLLAQQYASVACAGLLEAQATLKLLREMQ